MQLFPFPRHSIPISSSRDTYERAGYLFISNILTFYLWLVEEKKKKLQQIIEVIQNSFLFQNIWKTSKFTIYIIFIKLELIFHFTLSVHLPNTTSLIIAKSLLDCGQRPHPGHYYTANIDHRKLGRSSWLGQEHHVYGTWSLHELSIWTIPFPQTLAATFI